MENKEQDFTTDNTNEQNIEETQVENKDVNVDPKKVEDNPETVSTKKTFRITQTHKEMSDKLEAESGSATANEYFGKLLKAFTEVNNMEDAVYTQDYRFELVEHLKRTVEIFDQIERRNEIKRNTYMSRNADKVNELTTKIEELKLTNQTLEKDYKKEIEEINDKYVVETSQLNLQVKKYEEEISKHEKKIAELQKELERSNKDLKETETKLTESIKEQSQIMNSMKEKDKVINELSEENRDLNKKVLSNVQEVSQLERENRELASKVSNLTDKVETTLAFQNQQKELFEEQIKAYKEMISNKK